MHVLSRLQRTWSTRTPSHTVLLPSVDPRFLLAVQGPENTSVSVCTTCDQQAIYTVDGIEDMMSAGLPGNWCNHQGEPRVSFVPWLNALVTLPEDNQRVVVRHLNLIDALEATTENYLFVVSVPKTRAVAGNTYEYQIDARSRRGGLRYKLESAPEGMTLSSDGQLRWTAPSRAAGTTSPVVVLIVDADGQELFHSFSISIVE